jgi:hypothetical protein
MTEPIKLDDLKHQDQCRYWRHGDSCDCGADQLPEHLAVEQATADLRAELTREGALREQVADDLARAIQRAEKAEADRDEARAELARLTTAAQKVIDRMQMDIDDGSRPDQWSMEDMVRTLRTPLPPVKEATDDQG